MLKQRILTAVVLAPVVLAIIWFSNLLAFNIFTAFLAFMISYEWVQIVTKNKSTSIIVASGIALFVLTYRYADFIHIDVQRLFWAAAFVWAVCFGFLIQHRSVVHQFKSKLALGLCSVLLFAVSLNGVHQFNQNGAILTLVLFFLIWIADVGAYITGKSIGKNKLAVNISPGKTIEGLMGGVILSAVFGYFIGSYLKLDSISFAIGFAVIAGISVLGDLFASLIKRHGHVKDSGHLLPGHGGFLDRFDAMIAASPFYFAFIHYAHQL